MESVRGTDHTRASLPSSAIQNLCSISGHEHGLPRQITTASSAYPRGSGPLLGQSSHPQGGVKGGCILWGLSASPSWKINLHTAIVNQGYITSLSASPYRLQRGTAPSSGCLPRTAGTSRPISRPEQGCPGARGINVPEDSGRAAPRSFSCPQPKCTSTKTAQSLQAPEPWWGRETWVFSMPPTSLFEQKAQSHILEQCGKM